MTPGEKRALKFQQKQMSSFNKLVGGDPERVDDLPNGKNET